MAWTDTFNSTAVAPRKVDHCLGSAFLVYQNVIVVSEWGNLAEIGGGGRGGVWMFSPENIGLTRLSLDDNTRTGT